jgi:hypothetical protein
MSNKLQGTPCPLGSATDIEGPLSDVRFTPQSRHRLNASKCPSSAKSGHSALRKERRYSITSSAEPAGPPVARPQPA